MREQFKHAKATFSHIPVISAYERWRQEDGEFKASLGTGETPPEKKIFVKQTQAAGTLSLVSAGEC